MLQLQQHAAVLHKLCKPADPQTRTVSSHVVATASSILIAVYAKKGSAMENVSRPVANSNEK